jgi:pimeloyl-ACP methyl ester carboxylesterase
LYDIGEHRLHMTCRGTPTEDVPTLVYLHGLGGTGGDWQVLAPFTERTRVCTYDRLNVGRSDSASGRHTGLDSVRDLEALLESARVHPPSVLIGFSFGGLLATMYAGAHPDQVTGLMSIDGSLPSDGEVDLLIPAAERPAAIADAEANDELTPRWADRGAADVGQFAARSSVGPQRSGPNTS